LDDVAKAASIAFKAAGEIVLLIGGAGGWLGRSAWLETICGRQEGAPPPVDLTAERRNGAFILALIGAGRLSAVHDISDGGLAVAVAEMAMAGNLGAAIDAEAAPAPLHGFLFGEDQGRYIVTTRAAEAGAILAAAAQAGVVAQRLGTTGGESLTLPGELPILVAQLAAAFESWFPAFMAGRQRETA
jgi:phosphoribosylformylglycinamidine synthase